MTDPTPAALLARFERAKLRREFWESHWRECYDYALPQRDGAITASHPGERKMDRLFDGTAPDAVDQLAASLLAQLTPPWSRWFGLAPGVNVPEDDLELIGERLEDASRILQTHFDQSNFAVEIHQCYLDLVTCGTATLLFEEAPFGDLTAFRFTAVPLGQVAFEEDSSGRLVTTFRRTEYTYAQFKERFPAASPPDAFKSMETEAGQEGDTKVAVVEMVTSSERGYRYLAALDTGCGGSDSGDFLVRGTFRQSPFINFRWLKAPGEIYGRSPVMKALPDIKTANKVVELVLKNASIAVTGIWQIEDDGVINPATIKLAPGTIIPKAVGSAGLTPLEAPGKFDVSQLVLDDLRGRIRHALLVDQLGQADGPRMTATEVLERAAEMARILGATYGRLQSELLTPLVMRGASILSRRGEIPVISLDGQIIELEYKSPLARRQAQQEAQSALLWMENLQALGPEALKTLNVRETALWLARALGVPRDLVRSTPAPVSIAPASPSVPVAPAAGAPPEAEKIVEAAAEAIPPEALEAVAASVAGAQTVAGLAASGPETQQPGGLLQ